MIHTEWFDKVFPSLRLSRSFLRKASGRIEDRRVFQEVLGERWERWFEAYGTLHKLLLSHFDQDSFEKLVQVLTENVFSMMQYIRRGERAFRVERNLAQLLMGTDLPEVLSEDFQLPFRAIYIEFPKVFTIRLSNAVETTVVGAYVVDNCPHENLLTVTIAMEPKRLSESPLLGLAGPFGLLFEPGKAIDWNIIRDHMNKASFSEKGSGFTVGAAAHDQEDVNRLSSVVMNLVFNTIFYATSANPDLVHTVSEWRKLRGEYEKEKNAKRRRKLEEQMEDATRTETATLGRSIQVSYGRPEPSDNSSEADEHRKILTRFEVRGHWKNQPYGPGRQERRRMFIAPYWKGPADVAELLRRKYVMK